MKLPKETKRFCPYCRKHTKQTVDTAKQKGRSTVHPMSRGGAGRLRARGLTSGPGNKGKYSRRPPKNQKMKSKTTKRISVMYKCKECGKKKGIKKAIRSGRIEIGEKVAK
jgi:large subunit ribosomal protein L44e